MHIFLYSQISYNAILPSKAHKMCILFLYFCDKPSPDGYRLIMTFNRDESYFRPTADANFWAKNPNILSGETLMHNTC